MNTTTDNPLYLAAQWHNEGKQVAIATVIATWGSSPRPVGSQLIVDDTSAFSGSVSGGCVESAVITSALEVIHTGIPRIIEFGINDERAWEVGLTCGGQIQIYLERLN